MRGKCKTMTRHFGALFSAVATFTAAALPTAAYAFDWYGGASVGNNRYEVSGGDYFPNQTFVGSVDGNDGAWKAYIGMRLFEKYVCAEFGYVDFGTASAKGTVSGTPVTATSDTTAYTAALVGFIPVGKTFDAMIKLGFAAPYADITTTKAGVSTTEHNTDLKFYGGLGAQMNFTEKFAARLEYERFVQGSDGPPYANVLSVGFTYLFYTE